MVCFADGLKRLVQPNLRGVNDDRGKGRLMMCAIATIIWTRIALILLPSCVALNGLPE